MRFSFLCLSFAASVLGQIQTVKPTLAQTAQTGASQTNLTYAELDRIAGLDFLGCGYDIRYDQGKLAITVPIAQYYFTEGKVYEYPTDRLHVYAVPDQVFVRTVGRSDVESYTYTGVEQLVNRLNFDIGVDFTSFNNNSGEVCSTGAGNQQTCTNGTTANLLQLGLEFNYLKQKLDSTEVYVVENAEKTGLFQIYLDDRFLRTVFLDELEILTDLTLEDNPAAFMDFLEKYGTHYVYTATLGGAVKMTSTVNNRVKGEIDELGVSLTGQYISQDEAEGASSHNFATIMSGNIDFAMTKRNRKTVTETTSMWQLIGGDTRAVDLLTGVNASTQIVNWKLTITKNPVPIRYRVREIQALAKTDLLRSKIAAASKVFLETDANKILYIKSIEVPFTKRHLGYQSRTLTVHMNDGSIQTHSVSQKLLDEYIEALEASKRSV